MKKTCATSEHSKWKLGAKEKAAFSLKYLFVYSFGTYMPVKQSDFAGSFDEISHDSRINLVTFISVDRWISK